MLTLKGSESTVVLGFLPLIWEAWIELLALARPSAGYCEDLGSQQQFEVVFLLSVSLLSLSLHL